MTASPETIEAANRGNAPLLFQPFTLRGVTLKNRVVVSPMAMYSAQGGFTDDFHLVHLGRFALGGAGLVMTEATTVSEQGRITHGCNGLWLDAHVENLRRITAFLHRFGAAAGIQLGHSGHKGSSQRPWHGGGPLGLQDRVERGEEDWPTVSPSARPFDEGWPVPDELSEAELDEIVEDFRRATRRAVEAEFDVVELHCAHGYLLHSFLSPLANHRNDRYGGSLENRMRLPLRVAEAVRSEWPADRPMFVRISSIDGIDIGWSIEESVAFAKALAAIAIDAVSCSSGGMKLPRGRQLASRTPGFQVSYAARIRREADVATIAVGLIREARQAEAILAAGEADLIALAREMLFNPNWAAQAAVELCAEAGWKVWPEQFGWWLERRARLYAPRPDRQT
jgi:2,4-dienoyl-CoA reductase-like NADH-dependent reductase (Old Yellow Enzyme family)